MMISDRSRLFARSGRNIVPTAQGHALYEMLHPLLANVVSTFERLAETADRSSPHVSLVTGVRMMIEELGAPLRQFRKEYPGARMQLKTADNATAQQYILHEQADLAFLIEPPQDVFANGIDYEVLYPLEYLVAFPPRHRLVNQPHFKLADLSNEPLVIGSPDTIGRKQLDQARFRLGLKQPLNIVAETDNSAITIACVRAGLGVGIIASRPDGHFTRSIKTRSISEEVGQVNVVAAYRKGRQLTVALRYLISTLRDTGP